MAEIIDFPTPVKRSEIQQPKESKQCYFCSGLGSVLVDGNRYATCHKCHGEGIAEDETLI